MADLTLTAAADPPRALGFGHLVARHIYVSRPLLYSHCGAAEQQDRQADENGCRKQIKPAHIMRPGQGLDPVCKA